MKTLVVAPLKKELTSLVSVLNGVLKNEHGYLYKDMQFVVGGMGSENFRKSVLNYSNVLEINKVLAVGSCGAVSGINPLEVVEVTSVFDRDFKTQEILSNEIKSGFKFFKNLENVSCASGDGSVLDSLSKSKLSAQNIDVVTWETGAFFKVMKELGLPFSEVRVVTDLADEKGEDAFKKNLYQGMQKLGKVLR